MKSVNSSRTKNVLPKTGNSNKLGRFTSTVCLVCDSSLAEVEYYEDVPAAGLKKIFDSCCLFLNVNLPEDSSWDFNNDNFPFCRGCFKILQTLGKCYDELEVVHTKVAQCVSKVKHVYAKSVAKRKSVEAANKKKSPGRKKVQVYDERTQLFREQIQIDDNDYNSTEEMDSDKEEAFPSSSIKSSSQCDKCAKREQESLQKSTEKEKAAAKSNVDVSVQTEESVEKTKELGSQENEFDEYVNQQMQLLGSSSSSDDDDSIGSVETEVSDEDTGTGGKEKNGDQVETDKIVTKSTVAAKSVADQSSGQKQTSNGKVSRSSPGKPERADTTLETKGSQAVNIKAKELNRIEKLVQVSRPSWSISPTDNGFTYCNLKVKANGTTFFCELCEGSMESCSQEKVLDHLEAKHLGKDHWYPCELCEEDFRLIGQLHRHMRFKHCGKPDRSWTYMCSVCNKRFYSNDLVLQHLAVHLSSSGTSGKSAAKNKTRAAPSSRPGPKSKKVKMVEVPPVSTTPRRRLRARPKADKSGNVEIIDIDSSDHEKGKGHDASSDSDFSVSPRPKKFKKGSKSKPPPTKPSEATSATSREAIPLNKLVLCGGCGCRYFTESSAVIKTIETHYSHHLTQRALACRICCECHTNLSDMVKHVRTHFKPEESSNIVFYSPEEVPATTTPGDDAA